MYIITVESPFLFHGCHLLRQYLVILSNSTRSYNRSLANQSIKDVHNLKRAKYRMAEYANKGAREENVFSNVNFKLDIKNQATKSQNQHSL